MDRQKANEIKVDRGLDGSTIIHVPNEVSDATVSQMIDVVTAVGNVTVSDITVSEATNTVTSKKKRNPTYLKNSEYATRLMSELSNQFSKKHTPNDVNRAKKTIYSSNETNAGIVKMSAYIPTLDETSSLTNDEMLNQYSNVKLGFTREQTQIFLALFDVYKLNSKRSAYKMPFDIGTRDFHYDILGHNRNTKFRQSDYDYYKNICISISHKRIEYTTDKAKHEYLRKGKFKNISINSPIMIVEILEGGEGEYKEQVLRVVPTMYIQHEIEIMNQYSNCLPREFLNLKQHDNFVYFGLYINRMHKINQSHKVTEEKTVKGKLIKKTVTIKNLTYAWEVSIKKLVLEALPNGEQIIQEYKATERKKQFYNEKILPYLVKALNIYKSKGYILKFNDKDLSHYKKIFNDEELKIIIYFNYDKNKFDKKKN